MKAFMTVESAVVLVVSFSGLYRACRGRWDERKAKPVAKYDVSLALPLIEP
jgi:hypothetical protein